MWILRSTGTCGGEVLCAMLAIRVPPYGAEWQFRHKKAILSSSAPPFLCYFILFTLRTLCKCYPILRGWNKVNDAVFTMSLCCRYRNDMMQCFTFMQTLFSTNLIRCQKCFASLKNLQYCMTQCHPKTFRRNRCWYSCVLIIAGTGGGRGGGIGWEVGSRWKRTLNKFCLEVETLNKTIKNCLSTETTPHCCGFTHCCVKVKCCRKCSSFCRQHYIQMKWSNMFDWRNHEP